MITSNSWGGIGYSGEGVLLMRRPCRVRLWLPKARRLLPPCRRRPPPLAPSTIRRRTGARAPASAAERRATPVSPTPRPGPRARAAPAAKRQSCRNPQASWSARLRAARRRGSCLWWRLATAG